MKYYYLLCVITILLMTPSPAYAIVWEQVCARTGQPDITITCDDLSITNIQLSAPVRGIRDIHGNLVPEYNVVPSTIFDLKKGNDTVGNQIVLTEASEYVDPDKIMRVVAAGFTEGNSPKWIIENYDPRVSLTMYRRQMPELSVTLTTDKTRYESRKDERINLTVRIQNTGEFDINDAVIKLNPAGLNVSSYYSSTNHEFNTGSMKKDQIREYTYNFDVPDVKGGWVIYHTISAMAKVDDPEIPGRMLFFNTSYSISTVSQSISPRVTVYKSLPDHFYTSDNVTVVITVINQGTSALYGVIVNDSGGGILYPLNASQELQWYFNSVKPGEQAAVQYFAYPVKTGNRIVIHPATIQYSYYGQPNSTTSNTPISDIVNNPRFSIRTPPPAPVINITTTPAQTPQPNVTTPATVTPPALMPPVRPAVTPITVPGFDMYLMVVAFCAVIGIYKKKPKLHT